MSIIKIDNLNINGEGISKNNNKKYCVSGVLPGEIVDVEKIKSKDNFVLCKLNNVVQKSPFRVVPKCKYFSTCGGCDFMMCEKSAQRKIKKEILQDYFKDYFKSSIKINSGKNDFYYRNKVSFYVKNKKIGLLKKGGREVVEIDKCIVINDKINKILPILRDFLIEIDNKYINHIVIRCLDDHMHISLVTSRKPKTLGHLVENLKGKLKNNFSLFYNFNFNSKDILSDKWLLIYGEKYLKSTYKDLKFSIAPHSFMQINLEVMEKMYERVVEEVKNQNVVECYSGIGLLSIICSKTAKSVTAVEINKSSSLDANRNKEENNIKNLTNINDDALRFLKNLKEKDFTLLVDPARSGLGREVIDEILRLKPPKIVYISCNPYTLRQNLYRLKDVYYVENMEFFDIFPQTFEIETFVVLKIK